jgi:hypothetical protein
MYLLKVVISFNAQVFDLKQPCHDPSIMGRFVLKNRAVN